MNETTTAGDDVTTFAYLCIGCPLGCRLELDENEHGTIVEIRGRRAGAATGTPPRNTPTRVGS